MELREKVNDLEKRLANLESVHRLYGIAQNKLEAIHKMTLKHSDAFEFEHLKEVIKEAEQSVPLVKASITQGVATTRLEGQLGKVVLKCVRSESKSYQVGKEYEADFDGTIYHVKVGDKVYPRKDLKGRRNELVIVR